MNCPICSTVMVLAQATSFGESYHYCRTCKKELAEIQISPLAADERIMSRQDLPAMMAQAYVVPGSTKRFFQFGLNETCRDIAGVACHFWAGPYHMSLCQCTFYENPGVPAKRNSPASRSHNPVYVDYNNMSCKTISGLPHHFWPGPTTGSSCECGAMSPGNYYRAGSNSGGSAAAYKTAGSPTPYHHSIQGQVPAQPGRTVSASPALGAPYGTIIGGGGRGGSAAPIHTSTSNPGSTAVSITHQYRPSEACRTIGDVPTHFWPKSYNDTSCQCGTYLTPNLLTNGTP